MLNASLKLQLGEGYKDKGRESWERDVGKRKKRTERKTYREVGERGKGRECE